MCRGWLPYISENSGPGGEDGLGGDEDNSHDGKDGSCRDGSAPGNATAM
jgi:hypothetical protein